MSKHIIPQPAKLALLAATLSVSLAAHGQAAFNLIPGWNLVGNSDTTAIDVAAQLGDASKITTVWNWDKATSKWGFYAPAMSPTALAKYAQDKGYDVLTSIGPKDGFWVNASSATTVSGPATAPAALVASDLKNGWNLMGSADNQTPLQLDQTLGSSLSAAGKGMTSAWAWDAVNRQWKFYSPTLQAQGGTVLADYVSAKGYLPFSSPLLTTDGFWLNIASVGRAPVILGTAGNFVILSKAGITDVPASAITGNIGTSPISAAFIDVTCPEITGTIYGVDAAYTGNGSTSCFAGSPPAANKTLVDNAVLDMGTAFNDAAGRTTPDFTELGAGDISGLTLAPGLYKWGTGVLLTSAGVTLAGGANDVWIFQIGQDLVVNNSAIVTLTGGAQAKNIFWQVEGKATLGTAADFKGIILSKTLVSLATGATVNGRLYAQTEVTLQMNTVTNPAP
ncbi:MAG: ice-binding family protein [Rhodoferax sp.]|nr:ice-binding family protein [Rhodoferax sp.]